MSLPIRPEFKSHELNATGQARTTRVAEIMSRCLVELEAEGLIGGREAALVITHLQTAKMWATRAVALLPENQQPIAIRP